MEEREGLGRGTSPRAIDPRPAGEREPGSRKLCSGRSSTGATDVVGPGNILDVTLA